MMLNSVIAKASIAVLLSGCFTAGNAADENSPVFHGSSSELVDTYVGLTLNINPPWSYPDSCNRVEIRGVVSSRDAMPMTHLQDGPTVDYIALETDAVRGSVYCIMGPGFPYTANTRWMPMVEGSPVNESAVRCAEQRDAHSVASLERSVVQGDTVTINGQPEWYGNVILRDCYLIDGGV